ncbi:MAG: metallophosphoesterase family protein [Anaerolineae bacterium]
MSFLGKKKSKKLSRLFFATDIHGSERTYRKFINAGKFYEVNTIVMGGDISGKLLIPIIKEAGGGYRATLQGTVHHITNDDELKQMQDRLGLLGFYNKIMDEDEFKELSEDHSKVDTLFHELARKRLAEWVDLAETRLKGTGIRCFVTGGNDDDPEVLEAIHGAGQESFFACEGQVVQIDDNHTMASVGFSNPTPWNTPREIPDEKLAEIIEGMCAQVKDFQHCIFNFHVPPIDSTLDTCPKLDWSTDPPSPIVSGGQIVFAGAGSPAVRKSIEKYQPMLGLHGHIHESQGVAKIGRTTCLNPGSEYGEGILRGCLVTFCDGVVEGYQMTSG